MFGISTLLIYLGVSYLSTPVCAAPIAVRSDSLQSRNEIDLARSLTGSLPGLAERKRSSVFAREFSDVSDISDISEISDGVNEINDFESTVTEILSRNDKNSNLDLSSGDLNLSDIDSEVVDSLSEEETIDTITDILERSNEVEDLDISDSEISDVVETLEESQTITDIIEGRGNDLSIIKRWQDVLDARDQSSASFDLARRASQPAIVGAVRAPRFLSHLPRFTQVHP